MGVDRNRSGAARIVAEAPGSRNDGVVTSCNVGAGGSGVLATNAVHIERNRAAVVEQDLILAVLHFATGAVKTAGGRNRRECGTENRPYQTLPYAGAIYIHFDKERRRAIGLLSPCVELNRILVMLRACR